MCQPFERLQARSRHCTAGELQPELCSGSHHAQRAGPRGRRGGAARPKHRTSRGPTSRERGTAAWSQGKASRASQLHTM
eukprot:8531870-Alexandrium_andersonii.AAC.1